MPTLGPQPGDDLTLPDRITPHPPVYRFVVDGKPYNSEIPDLVGAHVRSVALRDHAYTVRQDTGPRYWEHPVISGLYPIDLRWGHVPRFYTVPPCFYVTR